VTVDDLRETRRGISREVRVDPGVQAYLMKIVAATRNDEAVQLGAGPRASLALLDVTRVLAVLRERDYVTPDDVKSMAGPVLSHRLILAPEAEMEGLVLDDVLKRIYEKVEVPR
jgi:MoxR-like ATPase